MKSKTYIFLFIGLVTGYLLYPVTHPEPTPILSKQTQDKFQAFVNKEATNFANLQEADAKLKAAEEMYGKMMVLFLADLGLKNLPVSKPVIHVEEVVESAIEEVPVQQEPAIATKNTSKVVAAESSKLTPSQQVFEDYRKAMFADSLKDNAIKRFLGNFEGNLRHQAGPDKGRVDFVFMNFNLTQEEKGIDGTTLVTMSDPSGVEYSRNAGKGGNRAIKIGNKADTYYIDASPTSYFVLDLSNFPNVIGQYYEKDKLIGLVTLKKVEH